MNNNWVGKRVAIVEGVRTPFAKSGTAYRNMTSVELGILAVRELIARADIRPDEIDELVYGTVVHSVQAPNIAREVGLGAGVPPDAPAFTVARACASANQAITSAAETIARGYADTIIAGGAESLTDIPILYSKPLRDAVVAAARAKSPGQKLAALARVRPKHLAPITPAIAEPSTGETMGQSAERMAKENGISREAQDRWALRSHQLAAKGTEDGRLKQEIVPAYIPPDYQEFLDS
ncbi:MAG TPA: beta-ketoacyl synthase N-terminal-like domain-containing protein, partial [Longimicrobiales bacterium]